MLEGQVPPAEEDLGRLKNIKDTRDQGWVSNREERTFEIRQGLADQRRVFGFCQEVHGKSKKSFN